jgi:hypothetical protein
VFMYSLLICFGLSHLLMFEQRLKFANRVASQLSAHVPFALFVTTPNNQHTALSP